MSARLKFYLDEHVNPAVAMGLRQRGVDVLTTQEASMLGASDEDHLAMAAGQNRVVFTQDDDFLRLHAQGIEHAGLVYVRQRTSIGYIVRGLVLIYQMLTSDEMKNRLEFL
jgi:predicted nuclease of predicted toxin-antitoxin system